YGKLVKRGTLQRVSQLNQDDFRKLISGTSSGLGAALLRFLLAPAAAVYAVVIRLRNFLYSRGLLKIHQASAAVISIGNITTGGTGKTPLVVWLYNEITQNSKSKIQNYNCAILTRGYKTTQNSKLKTQNYIDEPVILAESCPQAPVIINPDRVAGAAKAVEEFGANVLIMDDGFQHRRLARDLDIVAIDATCPFGYGKILPAGLLREPIFSLKRADAVVITRCDQSTDAELARLEDKLRGINPDMIITKAIHAPVSVKYPDHSVIAAEARIQKNSERADSNLDNGAGLEQLKGKKIFAFCGIGN
ncbi:unnamed protein product, partial [marine sediment metagenome]